MGKAAKQNNKMDLLFPKPEPLITGKAIVSDKVI